MTDFGAASGATSWTVAMAGTSLCSAPRPRKNEIDKILDFKVKDDGIWLDDAVFRKLGKGTEASPKPLNKAFFTVGTHARDKNDYLIYDPAQKTLFYDADGSGHGAAVAVVTFSLKQKLTAADLLVI